MLQFINECLEEAPGEKIKLRKTPIWCLKNGIRIPVTVISYLIKKTLRPTSVTYLVIRFKKSLAWRYLCE